MAHKNFKKENFVQNSEKQYEIEFNAFEIGKGINLIVERLNENGDYEMIQPPLRRLNNSIFIVWDHPFDGRIIFDE